MHQRISTIILLISCVVSLNCLPVSHAQSQFHDCPDSGFTIPTSTACSAINTCLASGSAWDVCLQPATTVLLRQCRADNLDNCEIRATLYAVALLNIRWSLNWLSDNAISDLMAMINALDSGDLDTALLLYENVTLALDYKPEYTLELGSGLLYLQDNKLEKALEQFQKSISLEFDNPLAYYYRGLVYRQMEQEQRAIQDFYTYDLLVDPELKRLLPLASFALRFAELQSWRVYPVFGYASSTSAQYEDRTLNQSYPILISWLNDGKTLAVSELMQRTDNPTPKILFLEQDETNPTRYMLLLNAQDYGGEKRESYRLSINVLANRMTYYESIDYADGVELIGSTLLPASEADIRQTVDNRPCDGLGLSFIEIGDKLQQTYAEPIRLLDEPPAKSGLIDLTQDDFSDPKLGVSVLDGPICYDNQVWWQVSNGTVTGWIAESITEYTDLWRPDETTSYYYVMPVDLIDSWSNGIPSPMQFLGLSTSSE